MSRILLVPELRRLLGDLSQAAELCDESGNVLATLLPGSRNIEPILSEQELEEIERSNAWYTTDEVLARLR
jgi:hypothetical protein